VRDRYWLRERTEPDVRIAVFHDLPRRAKRTIDEPRQAADSWHTIELYALTTADELVT
jgi:hypothetical protein